MTKKEAKLLSGNLANFIKERGYTPSIYHAATDHMYIVANHSDFSVYEYDYVEDCDG